MNSRMNSSSNSTTCIISEAIELNNKGASFLNAGDTLSALQLLRQAVVALKDSTSTSTAAPRPPSQHQHATVDTSSNPAAPGKLSDSGNNFRLKGLFFVYTRPLYISTNYTTITSQAEHDHFVHMASTHLVFNLALACHCFGNETGHSEALNQAMELYHVVLASSLPFGQCGSGGGSGSGGGGDMDSALLHCLVLNNLAHLHYEQCDYDCCSWCLASVEEVVLQTDCLNHNGYDGPSCLTELEAEELKLNMVFVQQPCAAHAA